MILISMYWKYFFSVKQFVVVCVLLTLCHQATSVNYTTIGVLGPWNTSSSEVYPFWATRTLGAVHIAIDDINTAGILGDGQQLRFVYRDTDCDSRQASGSAVELFLNEQVDAYLAPPCSNPCRSVADLASFWYLPTVSWFCAENDRGGESHNWYLARTFAPFTHLGEIAVTTMRHYDWNVASVITPGDSTWETLAHSIEDRLLHAGVDVSQYVKYSQPLSLETARELLKDASTVSHGKI